MRFFRRRPAGAVQHPSRTPVEKNHRGSYRGTRRRPAGDAKPRLWLLGRRRAVAGTLRPSTDKRTGSDGGLTAFKCRDDAIRAGTCYDREHTNGVLPRRHTHSYCYFFFYDTALGSCWSGAAARTLSVLSADTVENSQVLASGRLYNIILNTTWTRARSRDHSPPHCRPARCVRVHFECVSRQVTEDQTTCTKIINVHARRFRLVNKKKQ